MNPLTRYEPLVGRLDGLFDEFFRPALEWENNAAPQVRVDVKETPEAYTVNAELPGVRKDAIHVEIEGTLFEPPRQPAAALARARRPC